MRNPTRLNRVKNSLKKIFPLKQARKFVPTQDREIWTIQDTDVKLENGH